MSEIEEDQNVLRDYLLGRLAQSDEQRVELLLLTDAHYSEELDIVAEELTDQYVNDELSKQEREKLEKGLFNERKQLDQLQFAAILKRQKRRRAFLTSRNKRLLTIYIPVAAVVLIALGAGIWRAFFHESDVEKGLLALQTAFKRERPLRERISGFNYAPPVSQLRGAQSRIDYVSKDRAAKFLLDQQHTAAAYHAAGTYYLADGQFDKAIEQFIAALNREPVNAQIHNDLGVALFEKGKNRQQGEQDQMVEEFNESLTHLNKALQLNDSLLEALFNRALLFEAMKLPQRAEEDWQRYLEKDPSSPWANEARENLKRLQSADKSTSESAERIYLDFLREYRAGNDDGAWRAITLSSARVGNYLVEKILDEYLGLVEKGEQDEANDRYQVLKYIGTAKQKRAGDHYFARLSQSYESISPVKLTALIAARKLMKLGQAQIASAHFAEALASNSEAKRLYKSAGDDAESKRADYWIAISHQQLSETAQSARLFKNLVQTCEQNKYRWLMVRALNALAFHEGLFSEYSKAIRYSLQAHDVAEQAAESYGNISALCALMQGYLYLGNRQQALRQVQQLLTSGNSSLELKQQWIAYNEAAWTANSFGLDAAAAEYQQVALRFAQELQEPSTLSLAYIRSGAMHAKASNYEKAFERLQDAFKRLESYAGEPFAQEMTAYAYLQLGMVQRLKGDWNNAIASFNSCIGIYEKLKLPAFVYEARKGKLLSHIASNDVEAARKEIDVTLDLFEKFRSTILEESNRNSFFDRENDVFDVAVDFEYSMGNTVRAFEYAERNRARSLLALTSNDLKRPSMEELRARIPEEVQTVQFSVLPHRVLIWVLGKEGFFSSITEIEAEQLEQKTEAYLRAIQSRDQDQTLQLGKELYRVLLQPIESVLVKNKQIYIVPDKILTHLPFETLRSPASERYLIEDHAVAMAPSMDMFLLCTDKARDRVEDSNEELLAVGNPAFDPKEFPDLPYLRSAGEEVDQIGGLYKHKRLLVWKQAIKESVIKQMTGADVIHLATHAITDERSPLLSKLVLAKDAKSQSQSDDSVLRSSEIYDVSFPRTTLVVLSACQTGSGPYLRGEGVMSMARPFLAGGVPLVVASLWAVDSDATAKLMVNFHKYRRSGDSTIQALQRAQLDMLRNSSSYQQPYYWASFNLIGGHAAV